MSIPEQNRMAKALEEISRSLKSIATSLTAMTPEADRLNIDKMREVRTESGRLVGYLFPDENVTLAPPDTSPYILITEYREEIDGTHFIGKGCHKGQDMTVTGVLKGLVL